MSSVRPARFALLAAVAACAPIPALSFVAGDDGGQSPGPDATISTIDSGATTEDGGADDAIATDPGDDAGPDAHIQCGATFVSDCADCAGSPLRCKKGTRDECLADCVSCAANWFPCLHCPTPDASPRGTCVAVNAHGQIACTTTNLCACNTPSDCSAVSGAAQTCVLESGHDRCLTCGSPTTADAACVSATGTAGVCTITDGAPPTCE